MNFIEQALVAATAMSLYRYNVPPKERAQKLYDEFEGECMEMPEMLRAVEDPYWATAMPHPTAMQYMTHALDRYVEEATRRVITESMTYKVNNEP